MYWTALHEKLTHLIEHKFLLIFLEELSRATFVQEQGIDSFDIIDAYFCALKIKKVKTTLNMA